MTLDVPCPLWYVRYVELNMKEMSKIMSDYLESLELSVSVDVSTSQFVVSRAAGDGTKQKICTNLEIADLLLLVAQSSGDGIETMECLCRALGSLNKLLSRRLATLKEPNPARLFDSFLEPRVPVSEKTATVSHTARATSNSKTK